MLSGDEWYVTSDGTNTGAISARYIYDGTAWVLTTLLEVVSYGTLDPVTAAVTGMVSGDEYYVTLDGTSATKILNRYIFDGTAWVETSIGETVSYGLSDPVTDGIVNSVSGDEHYTTVDGTSATKILNRFIYDGAAWIATSIAETVSYGLSDPTTDGILNAVSGDEHYTTVDGTSATKILNRYIFDGTAWVATSIGETVSYGLSDPTTDGIVNPLSGDEHYTTVDGTSATKILNRYIFDGTAWIATAIAESVTYGLSDPATDGIVNSLSGDEHYTTSDGTKTGVIQTRYIFDGVDWVIADQDEVVSYGTVDPVTAAVTGMRSGDEYYITVDGTSATKILSRYIFDGTAWVASTISETVSYGLSDPVTDGVVNPLSGDEHYTTVDGTSATKILNRYIYDGTVWTMSTISETVTYGTADPVTAGVVNPLAGDEHYITSDGTKTGVFETRYIFDGVDWVITDQDEVVSFGLSDPVTDGIVGSRSGDEHYTTVDGTSATKILNRYIFDGVDWVVNTVPETVTYGFNDPVTDGIANSLAGDEHYTTVDGTSATKIMARYIFDGTAWVATNVVETVTYGLSDPTTDVILNSLAGDEHYTTVDGTINSKVMARYIYDGAAWVSTNIAETVTYGVSDPVTDTVINSIAGDEHYTTVDGTNATKILARYIFDGTAWTLSTISETVSYGLSDPATDGIVNPLSGDEHYTTVDGTSATKIMNRYIFDGTAWIASSISETVTYGVSDPVTDGIVNSLSGDEHYTTSDGTKTGVIQTRHIFDGTDWVIADQDEVVSYGLSDPVTDGITGSRSGDEHYTTVDGTSATKILNQYIFDGTAWIANVVPETVTYGLGTPAFSGIVNPLAGDEHYTTVDGTSATKVLASYIYDGTAWTASSIGETVSYGLSDPTTDGIVNPLAGDEHYTTVDGTSATKILARYIFDSGSWVSTNIAETVSYGVSDPTTDGIVNPVSGDEHYTTVDGTGATRILARYTHDGTTWVATDIVERVSTGFNDPITDGISNTIAGDEHIQINGSGRIVTRHIYDGSNWLGVQTIERVSFGPFDPVASGFTDFITGDEHYKTVDGTSATKVLSRYIYDGTTWVETPISETVTYGVSDPATDGIVNALSGDEHYTTSDGTKTGVISARYIFDGVDWVSTTAQKQKVTYGVSDPATDGITGPVTGDEHYATVDGTSATKISARYIYDGTAWLSTPVSSISVNYTTVAPTVAGTEVQGDTTLVTSDGTSAGVIVGTYVFDGTAWKEIQIDNGTDFQYTGLLAAPTTRSDGVSALQTGDMYYSGGLRELYCYRSSAWEPMMEFHTNSVTFSNVIPTLLGTELPGDEWYVTSDGTNAGVIAARYIFDRNANAWVLIPAVIPEVSFGIVDPITAGATGVKGDEFIVTDDGTRTGAVLSVWIYDATGWVQKFANYSATVTFDLQDPVTAGATGMIAGDEWYVTSDGTIAGTKLERWIYNSTTWVQVPLPAVATISFNLLDPTAAGASGMAVGDEWYITADGTSAGVISRRFVYDGTAWVETPVSFPEVISFSTQDPGTAGATGMHSGDEWYVTSDGTKTGAIVARYIYDGAAWIKTTTPNASVQFNAQDPATAAISGGVEGDEYYVTSDGTNTGTVFDRYVWDGTVWVKTTFVETVSFNTQDPVTAAATNMVAGDEWYVTSDGTSTGAITARYIYNGTAWVNSTVSVISVQFNAQDPAFSGISGVVEGDEYYVTSDGTNAGKVFDRYVWDGAFWIRTSFLETVSFNAQDPVTASAANMVAGDEWYVTSDGTSAGNITHRYIYDGAAWVAASVPLYIDDMLDVDTTTVAPNVDEVLGWDGTNWVPKQITGTITVSDTAPVSPSQGDGWFSSTLAEFYVWYDDGAGGAAWINVNGAGSSGGATGAYVESTVTSLAANQVAVFNNAANKDSIVNTPVTISAVGDVAGVNNLTVNGAMYQDVDNVGSSALDCSTGNVFTLTVNSNVTFSFSNPPAAGTAYMMSVVVDHLSGSITWPGSVYWPDSVAPTLTAGNSHIFMFLTTDGGTSWLASSLLNYAV